MKNRILLILVFLAIATAFGQVNRKMEHDGAKEATSIINPEQDKSCLIVHSEITNLRVTSNNQIIDIDKKSSSDYWVWLAPGTHVLKFDAEGFMTLTFGPNTFARKRTYEMTVRAIGFGALARADENLIEATFNLNEDSVYISWSDDFAPNLNLKTTAVYKLPAGTYNFTFRKNGFKEVKKMVALSEPVRENITLEPGGAKKQETLLPGLLIVTSEPDTAEILINGQRVGTTRFQGEVMPGENQLEVRKPFYYSDLSTFKVESGKFLTINKKLKSRAAFLTVTGNVPKCKVYLNGKLIGVAPLTKYKVESGEFELKVSAELYHDYIEKFALKDGEEKNSNAILTPAFGEIEIETLPENGATVFIDGDSVGITPFSNSKIASGKYILKITRPLYSIVEEQIEIKDGQTIKRKITLESSFAELTIIAPLSIIYINGQRVGRDKYYQKMEPGKYVVRAERSARYNADVREVNLLSRSFEELTLAPQPKTGTLSIFVEPDDVRDARIFIGDEYKGLAPSVMSLMIGEYDLTVQKPNYLDFHQIIELNENDKKQVNIKMITYSGSRLEKSDTWGKAKWWSLGIGAAGAAAMGYFYYAKNSSFDKYQAATTTADAELYRQKTNTNENLFRASMGVAAGAMASGLISLVVQTIYKL